MDKKALNFPILISLVVGNMIGTGIYILPASLAKYGTISLASWIFTSVGALLLALTFASLNKRFMQTGGPYVYCKRAFGPMVGFIIAYIYWISNLVSIAGIAVASIGYFGYLTPSLDANNHATYHALYALLLELAAIWLFTLVNIIGIHTAGVVQLVLTVLKVMPLLIVSLVGLGHIHLVNLTHANISNTSTFTAMISAATLTFWAFIGLESATVPAENTRSSRDIYKATVYGTLATAFIYILSTFVLMGIMPIDELKNSQFPFAQAGTLLFGSSAANIIAACAILSGLGALNVCILVQGQIVFAAARDGLFPKQFAVLSKQDVPIAGQLFSSSLITLLLICTIEDTLLQQFNNIALLASLLTLITYFGTTLSEIKFVLLNKNNSKLALSKPMLIAILAAIYSWWMITSFEAKMLYWAMGIILICIPIYFLLMKKK